MRPAERPIDEVFYTVDEAAEVMRVDRSTVYRLMERGELGWTTFSTKARRISKAAILGLARRKAHGPA